MAATFSLGEALLLGLGSGPACVASCGPVLIPSLLAERDGLRVNARYLAAFLGTRLLGYILFAAVAWELRTLVPLPAAVHSLAFSLIYLVLGGVLLRYSYSAGKACSHPERRELVTIGTTMHRRISGAAAIGFLTGISLCPPFVAAAIRAAASPSVAAAVFFFATFFIGTSVWFVPFASLGWIHRNEAVTTVARMTMALIALFYLYIGVMTVIGRNAYGY
ncbi:MAG TPA: sulfite exporter TauE/SafE family protein [Candidatus Sulfotelmatobacter sp.]|nr:sulfite exporter TauE/SafE family protein [Candidatus Sulfotelmatobacter sp.]